MSNSRNVVIYMRVMFQILVQSLIKLISLDFDMHWKPNMTEIHRVNIGMRKKI